RNRSRLRADLRVRRGSAPEWSAVDDDVAVLQLVAERPERDAHRLAVALRAAPGAPDAARYREAAPGRGVERIGVPGAHDGAGRDASLEQGAAEVRADAVVDAHSLA